MEGGQLLPHFSPLALLAVQEREKERREREGSEREMDGERESEGVVK